MNFNKFEMDSECLVQDFKKWDVYSWGCSNHDNGMLYGSGLSQLARLVLYVMEERKKYQVLPDR